jgi:hypothetical protein
MVGTDHRPQSSRGLKLAQSAKPHPVILADRVLSALSENGYGQYDDLIGTLSPALGEKGLDHLKTVHRVGEGAR